MSDTRAAVARVEPVERCLVRIEMHLLRLAEGHDPWGHLFAIERLARSARAEWQEGQREPSRKAPGA